MSFAFFNTSNTIQSILLLENTTLSTLNNTNSSCYAILSQLGDFSKDKGIVEYGICPETWLSSSISIFCLVVYIIILFLCGIGLFWKRNSKHIRSRHPVYMVMTLFASSWCIITLCLRFGIGRRTFPCGIYLLSYFALPAAVIIPSIFRLFRLYYMHLMNLHKTSIFTLDKKEKSILQSLNFTKNESNNNNNNNTIELVQQDNNNDNDIIISSTNNNNNNTTTINGNDNVEYNNTLPQGSVDENMFDFDVDSSTMTADDATSWVDKNEVFEFHHNHHIQMGGRFNIFNRFSSAEQSHKIMNFLVSYKFIIPIYVMVSIIHIVIFIVLGGIEYGVSGKKGPLDDKLFATEGGGIYIFHRGCSSTTNVLIVVAVTTLFYMVFELIGLILYFFTDQDTWFIKREALFIVIIQFLTILLFIICAFIPLFKYLLDFFIPYGYLFIVYSLTEVIVSVILPIIYSIQYDRKMSLMTENSEIKYFLIQKRTFNILLDFARRSYAPESILCFKHIETYKKSSRKNRHKIALQIVNTYLKYGSPLELNYPKLVETHDEILKVLESPNSGTLQTNMFDKISVHCMNDMLDIFERLKSQNKQVKKLVEEWRSINMKKETK